jgi:hypothetical protein
MLNLYKAQLEIPCPRCQFPNIVSMREIRFGLTVLCRGCKVSIRLEPADGGVRKAKRLLDEFQHSLTQTINITIKL